jgi:hypothetical protein
MTNRMSRTRAFAILLTAVVLVGGCAPYRTMGTPTFVGSSRTKMYYLANCDAAKKIPTSERIFLETEKTALALGYTHSTDPGCYRGT